MLESESISLRVQVGQALTLLNIKGMVDHSKIEELIIQNLRAKGKTVDAEEIRSIVSHLVSKSILRDGEEAYSYFVQKGLSRLYEIART